MPGPKSAPVGNVGPSVDLVPRLDRDGTTWRIKDRQPRCLGLQAICRGVPLELCRLLARLLGLYGLVLGVSFNRAQSGKVFTLSVVLLAVPSRPGIWCSMWASLSRFA